MSESTNSSWWVYILECHDGTYYIGATTNVGQRLQTHQLARGAKYTRSRLPVKLVYSRPVLDHSTALKLEARLKKLSHAQKKALISQLNPPYPSHSSLT